MTSKDSLDATSCTTASAASAASSSSDSEEEGEAKAPVEGGRITAVKKAGVMQGKLRRVLRQEAPKGV